jgi:hypothetical protein
MHGRLQGGRIYFHREGFSVSEMHVYGVPVALHAICFLVRKLGRFRNASDRVITVAVRTDYCGAFVFLIQQSRMDAALLQLKVGMAAAAYVRGLRLILQLAPECSLRMFAAGEIRMAIRTRQHPVYGTFEFFRIDIGFDEFVVLEFNDIPVFVMAGQARLCFVRQARFPGLGRSGRQKR